MMLLAPQSSFYAAIIGRKRRKRMRAFLVSGLLALIAPILIAQQALTNDAIVKMAKAGLSEAVIVDTINASPGTYDTSANGLIALKNAGVSNAVIQAIVQRATNNPASPISADSRTSASLSATPARGVSGGLASSTATRISPGARVVIAPMGGFETYFAAAVREKKVPISLTLDKASAQYFVVSTDTQWQGFVYGSGATWSQAGGAAGSAASSTRGLEASIMLINASTKDIVWAYEVHKNSHGSLLFGTLGARGQQSLAEACAKHLKEFIEKGR